ncbi:MAG: aldolase catalytic domain-containing protein [Oscillospiraceae bacterium]
MSKIMLLDCTLRDGGYINNWQFGKSVIREICDKLSEAKIDIIETGFLTDLAHTEDQSLYSSCREMEKRCCLGNGISLHAAMIAIGEKEMDPVSLPESDECSLDIVRITFHRTSEEIAKAEKYARCLMAKGYKVCMQPVGTTSYSDKQLIELIERINVLKPYAFYLVDTLGILCREELMRFIYLIDNNLDADIKIGFHSHNNMQMSFANAQYLVEHRSSREFIVDCSVYGMGRGAGNLCTELIAQYLNNACGTSYNMVSVLDILDNLICPIHLKHDWGYNANYYIAAVHKCHPNYASFLMNKQMLTMNEIDLILKNLPADKRDIYDKTLIDHIYYDFQNHQVDDERSIGELKKALSARKILLLAPGHSIRQYKNEINGFIERENPVIISINGSFEGYRSDFVFVSNLKRLYSLESDSLSERLILTSNLPSVVANGLYVDYSGLCDQRFEESDNSGLMLIRLMKKIGARQLYIAGFDGFSEDVRQNYYDDKMINSINPEDTEHKNNSIRRQSDLLSGEIEIITLTPSRFFDKEI